MEQNEILQVVISSIPYPQQMKDIDLSEPDAVLFTWRGSTYRVSKSLGAEVCENGFLVGNDAAILMGAVLHKGRALSQL